MMLLRETMEMSEAVRCINTERPLTHSLDFTEEGLAMKATRTCSIDGCDRGGGIVRGLCGTHYERWRRNGTTADPQPRFCVIEGCGGKHKARGWCEMHYNRWASHGDPLVTKTGTEHYKWTGDAASYHAVHARVKAKRGPASLHLCQHCAQQAANWAYDHQDPNEKQCLRRGHETPYSVDPSHYMPLCSSCHKRFDLARKKMAQ